MIYSNVIKRVCSFELLFGGERRDEVISVNAVFYFGVYDRNINHIANLLMFRVTNTSS